MNEIIKKEESLTLTNKLNDAEKVIFEASQPKEMLEGVFTLLETKNAITAAKKAIKEFEADPKKLIKDLEAKFKQVEADLKAKVVETYKSEIVVKQYPNEETGEVTFKEFENNNLGQNVYTYTKATSVTGESIDYAAMLKDPEKYIAFVTPVRTWKLSPGVAELSIESAKELKLPIKKSTTAKDASVGIQWKQIEAKAKQAAEQKVKDDAELKNMLNEGSK